MFPGCVVVLYLTATLSIGLCIRCVNTERYLVHLHTCNTTLPGFNDYTRYIAFRPYMGQSS